MTTHALSFAVHVATSESDLIDACQVREKAYGHHLGDAVASFSTVEAADRDPETVVLICRDKLTGEAIGTARIQSNAARPLMVERSVILPHHIAARSRAEVTRLAVLPGADAMAKLCLMKAIYQYCEAEGIDWLVICARSEPLARNYRRLGFKDFLAPGHMVPLAHAGHIPHLVFTMDIDGTRSEWQRDGHRLQSFMFETTHPDLPRFQPAQQRSAWRQHRVA
ncbi:MAG: hypothetical protein KGL57_00455 [Burkholderiales bacterium]|nr:hypothetical protein [Burkholderiales bacterium]